ncbi:MAG: PAS domain S-box protein [Magnetococcus sp. DMHC-1]|nr:PAS domain S-box protein [Magnetococcales bacterium]
MDKSGGAVDAATPTWRIRRPLLVSFVASAGLMLFFFALSIDWIRHALEMEAYDKVKQDVSGTLQGFLTENVRTMTTILNLLQGDPRYRVPFQARDRETLLANTQKLHDNLLKANGITHFYFHGPDRVNFLRVYDPARYGDLVQRQTLLEAEKNGVVTHGLELGSSNTLTLRVVMPWNAEGRRIGFVELGMEVQSLLEPVKSILRFDLLMFLNKKFIDRKTWEKGMSLLERRADWEQLDNTVLVASTLAEMPSGVVEHLRTGTQKISLISGRLKALYKGDHIHVVSVPVSDIGGRSVARLVALFNDTSVDQITNRHLLMFLMGNLGVAALLGLMFHRILTVLEGRLRRANSDLRHSEQRLRAILDTAMDAIISIDTESHILEFNPAAEKIFGYRKEDVLGKDIRETIIPQEMRDAHRRGMARYLATGEKRVINRHIELVSVDVNGTRIPTEVAITVTPGQDSTFFTAYLRDITLRKQILKSLEDAIANSASANLELRNEVMRHEKTFSLLQSSEERFRSVTTSIWDAIIAVDQDQNIIFWNQGAQILFGYVEEEILGKKLDLLVPERYGDAHRRGFLRCLNQDGRGPLINQITELAGIHRDGRELPLEMSLNSWVSAENQRFFSAVIRDISERQQANAALLEAKNAAEKANQAKSIFLANMSHEIRTPMNTIIGMGYLLSQSDLEPNQQVQMQKIQIAAETLLGIIDDILDFSKIEAGHLELEHVPFNLQSVLSKVSGMISLRAEEKGLEVMFAVPATLPRALIGDALRLEQILLNLGTNAVKFTRSGEVVFRVDPIEEMENSIKLEFTVKDTGIGLSQEQIDGLFQAFSQADTSTTRNYGGTGLGLAICKRLVGMMGGEIFVNSILGSGSKFSFIVSFEKQFQSAVDAARMPVKPAQLESLRVLIADDNDSAREILENMVRELGLSHTSVTSGEAAIGELERAMRQDNRPYDMVLLDWHMPGMDGIETARRISNNDQIARSSMVVMVTAFDRRNVMTEARNVGIQRVILKPVTPSVLLNTILDMHGRDNSPVLYETIDDAETQEHRNILQGARVLVVEDHDVNWQVAEGILGKAGIITERATNGLVAVERILNHHGQFDCLLMDLQMPVMDGYVATQKLREKLTPAQLPIIAMTAHALKSEQERCLALGMNDYMTKPVNIKNLFKTLARVLAPLLESRRKSQPVIANPGDLSARQEKMAQTELYGIDVQDALERFDGDFDLLNKLLTAFANKYAALSAEVTTLLDQSDMEGIQRLVHGIKGSAGNVSAKKVALLAGKIEKMIRQNDISGCKLAIHAMTGEVAHVIQAIAHWQPLPVRLSSSESEGLVGNGHQIEDRLRELHRLIQDQDFQAREVFKSIKMHLVLHVDGLIVSRIEHCLDNLEFEDGARLVNDLLVDYNEQS